MHFSIPDTQELKDDSGASYRAFNVHINGVFHCSLRFKQFHYFNELLKKEFGANNLPPFPGKKLLSLNLNQIEERRLHIEKYIQLVSQEQGIARSDTFNSFLLNAQQETAQEEPEQVTLDVYLMNGHCVSVNILSTDQTDDVHETVMANIHLPEDFTYHFGLFLVKKEDAGETSIVWRLQEFESPYLSLHAASKIVVRRLQEFESPYLSLHATSKIGNHRIVIRKAYWEPSIDDSLIDDRIAMNLLYVQAVSDVERQWTDVTKEQMRHLESLRDQGSKKEYLRHARTLKHYGFIQFKPCITDYPKANTRVIIKIGQKELVLKVPVEGGEIKEAAFKITRMRCWRIGTLCENDTVNSNSHAKLELAFEYLIAQNSLQWVSIQSDQAILMSMCLQSMVDELIDRKHGKKIRRPQDRVRTNKSVTYLKRDATTHQSLSRQSSNATDESEEYGAINKARDSVKKITDKITSSKPTNTAMLQGVTENTAFEDIRDEDL